MLAWCRDHGIRVYAVDVSPDVWWRLGTEEIFAGQMAVGVPEGEELVRQRGLCPFVNRGNAVAEFWRDYVDTRTKALAQGVRTLLRNGKVVLVCGEAHAAPKAVATRFGSVCHFLSGLGVADYLKDQTCQTVLYCCFIA
jgi:hypothetical protein